MAMQPALRRLVDELSAIRELHRRHCVGQTKNEPIAEDGRGASSQSSPIERGRSESSQLGRYEIHNPISSRTRKKPRP
jgi:hypothetical protein